MLPPLDRKWELVASRTRGAPEDFDRLIAKFPHAPEEYLDIARDSTEYQLKHLSGQYFRIWSASASLEMDDAHHISQQIGGAVPIGDDGGDRVVLYLDGKNGFGLYRVGFGSLDREDAIWIADSLTAILCQGTGILHDDIW